MDRLFTIMIICSILLFFSEKMIFDFILYGVMAVELIIAGLKFLKRRINWT